MSGGGAALVAIPLRDGSELRVTPEGVRAGDRLYELGRIQDARQVAPDPVTLALRVAGAGMVEFQPVQPSDGMLVLEAIFRLRPELRPAGFEPAQAALPGFPPLPSGVAPYPPGAGYPAYPPQLPYPPQGYAPPGYAPPAGTRSPYGPPRGPAVWAPGPNRTQGELTPYPRSTGETLSAIFQLYGKHFRTWLALGLWVVLPQALLIGALNIAQDVLSGTNPFAPLPSSTGTASSPLLGSNACTLQVPTISGHDLAVMGGFTGASLVLSALFGAWQTGAFAHAGREAVLGQRVPVGASVRSATRRFVPVLVASLLALICKLIWIVPGAVLLGLALIDLNGANLCDSQALVTTHPTAAALDAIGFMLLIAGALITVLFAVRLAVAPYVAATESVGPIRALRRSWQLSSGSWWRMFAVMLVMVLTVGVFSLVIVALSSVLPAAELLVANPLTQLLASPLLELTYVVILFDLRLRREGYASLMRVGDVAVGVAKQASPPVG